jgi:hypothetical protein
MLQHFATGLLAMLPLLENQLCRKLHLARDVVARVRNRSEIRVPERAVWHDEIRRVRHVETSARSWSFVAFRTVNP